MRARREPSMIFGLARSAGVIDRISAWTRSISRSSKFSICSLNWPIPGSIPMIFDSEPILRTDCICSRKSSSVKSPPWPLSFAAAFAAWSASNAFSACSMSVRMSPMPRIRDAIRSGWKTSKSVSFSPFEANITWRPVTWATDRAAPPRASPSSLDEHDAGEADAVEERLGRRDGVLADHRVDDEEDLVRVDRVADVRRLLHELGVDAEPASGVDDDDVVEGAPRLGDSVAGHRHRVADAVAGLGGEDRDTGLSTDDLELGHGVRPLQVGGDEQRRVALFLQPAPSLPARVVLPDPCRPASMMTVGGFFAN